MIGADPAFYLKEHFKLQSDTPGALTDEALDEYNRCFCTPEAIHASCEDYRAAADIDLEMDEEDEKADRKIECPILALWERKAPWASFGMYSKCGDSMRVDPFKGKALSCGHYLAEERPEAVLQQLLRFFADRTGRPAFLLDK